MTGGTSLMTDEERQRREAEERAVGRSLVQGTGPDAKVRKLVFTAVLVFAGIGARTVLVPGLAATAVTVAVLAGRALTVPAVPRLREYQRLLKGQPPAPAPEWVAELDAHRRSLDGRVPAATLEAADRYLTAVAADRWRSAHLYVTRRTGTHWLPMGVTVTDGDRVRIYLGDYVAADPQVAAATLAHEVRHTAGWRPHLHELVAAAQSQGWLILGWAVPGRWLLPAAASFQVLITAAMWGIEISCDLAAASAEGQPAMTALFDAMTASAGDRRPARWRRYAFGALVWMTGRRHPPVAVRRAIVRVLGGKEGRLAENRTRREPPGSAGALTPCPPQPAVPVTGSPPSASRRSG